MPEKKRDKDQRKNGKPADEKRPSQGKQFADEVDDMFDPRQNQRDQDDEE